jgi:O-antigen/teichoic acid export membrane protein
LSNIGSEVIRTPLKSKGSFDNGKVKNLAMRGAIWVTMTSAVAVPLAYYRNWVLGRIDQMGEVVGSYAIIMLFYQVVTTFVIFGGSSVVTNFLPKIKRKEDKSSFLFTYSLFSILLVVVFVTLINLFPGTVSLLIRKPVDTATLRILSFLAPIIVFSQMITFSLSGFMDFRLSSVLSQIQLFFVCILATTAILFFSRFLHTHAIVTLAVTVVLANLVVIVIGVVRVFRLVSRFIITLHLPKGFWRFAGFVHLNTFSTFAYQSIDQLFVLAALGTSELGAYFVLLQCAQLIGFVPSRIGQVMLASFSHLVASGNHNDLRRAYVKLCRVILILSTPLALLIVLFSHPIARIFGEWYAERHLYLLLLAAAAHIASLGTVNSMLIMAKERTGIFLGNSIILISLQLAITLLLLDDFGVYAVIAGKAAGIASGQIGLFSIVSWKLDDIRLSPPNEYWIALTVVLSAVAVSVYWNPLPLVWAVLAFILLLCGFIWLIRFRVLEIVALLDRGQRRQSTEKS